MTIDPVAFVASLPDDLHSFGRPIPTQYRLEAELAEGKDEGLVVDGSVVSFVANVSAQARQDTLNSTLLAQLAANQVGDRQKDTERWYAQFTKVLQIVGWTSQAFNFTEYESSGATVTMNKVVLELLAAIASQNEVSVMTKTLDALKALDKGDGRLTLFETASSKGNGGNFQAGVASEVNGALALSVAASHFTSSSVNTGFLWFNFKGSSIRLHNAKDVITLNTDVYDRVRDTIVKKLGDKAVDFVGKLDIG